jgi:hypothetical protein
MTPEQRRLRAQIAANTRWSRPMARADAAETARASFYARLERQVDPQGRLPPAERDRLVRAAARAFSARLNSLKSRKQRPPQTALRSLYDKRPADVGRALTFPLDAASRHSLQRRHEVCDDLAIPACALPRLSRNARPIPKGPAGKLSGTGPLAGTYPAGPTAFRLLGHLLNSIPETMKPNAIRAFA